MQTSGHMSNCTEIGGTFVPTWAVGSCVAPRAIPVVLFGVF